MSKPLSKRQKAYRDYLATDHWKDLREEAIYRDGGKCCRCGSSIRIQVHHKCYRGRYEDSLLEDLETVCRECHRKEHGFGPSEFEQQARKLIREMNYIQPGCKRIPASEWKKLHGLIRHYNDLWDFAEVMFHYVVNYQSHFSEGFATNWWTDKARQRKWFERAFAVRQHIWYCSLDWEEELKNKPYPNHG
jgi:hypothetical protein